MLPFIANMLTKKQYADFYILWGDSQMDGRAVIASIPDTSLLGQLNAWIYNPNISNIDTLQAGVNNQPQNASSTLYGPELSFAKNMSTFKNKKIYLAKRGQSSSTLQMWIDTYFPILKTYVQKTIENEKMPLQLKGIIQCQGGQDAVLQVDADSYLTKLTTIYQSFDSLFASLDAKKFKYLGYKKIIFQTDGSKDSSEVYRSTVQAAQASYAANSANNAICIVTEGVIDEHSDGHYSELGEIQVGNIAFQKLRDI